MRRLPLLASAALLASACPHLAATVKPVNHGGRARPVADARDLLAQLTLANDGWGTLETVHAVTIEIALGQHRSEKRSFRGLLAVRRPAHFRLQILGPAAIKLLDILYADGASRAVFVAPELARSSRLPELVSSIAGDIAAVYRLDPQPVATRRHLEESISFASGRAPLYELKEYRGETLIRQLTVFAATLAVSRCELADGHGGSRTIVFGDYEQHGKVLVPRSVHLAREGAAFYWLAIRVESVRLDVPLDKRLFLAE
jgi:hypothetical protein